VGCFSFYANKIITTGEGGMLVTNDDAVAEKARRLKDQAYSPARRFLHTDLGFNYRMTNIQAAIGLAQLESIDSFVDLRRRHAFAYNAALGELPGITLPPEKEWARSVYWMYSILIGDGFPVGRDELMTRLKEKGVDTRAFFIPMHMQPAFATMGLFKGESYPVAEELSRRGLYLPSGSGLKEEDLNYVCRSIREIAA
jgi:perosamine synthetase